MKGVFTRKFLLDSPDDNETLWKHRLTSCNNQVDLDARPSRLVNWAELVGLSW